MNPIIKWPGGKSRELATIRPWLPPFSTWVEPFVGGGAFFFRLEPERALLNDVSGDLVCFYRAVRRGDPEFFARLSTFAADREEMRARARRRAGAFAARVARIREGDDPGPADDLAVGRGDGPIGLAATDVAASLARSVASKAGRLVGLERKHDKVFTDAELAVHFETALQAGYYTAVRDLYRPGAAAGRTARFWFLRELCYGSMFRYGKDGRFNIPYGGISYNRIRLAEKAARLASDEVRSLLGRARLSRADFGEFLEEAGAELAPDAFVFLDPPYDTEFSDYANRGFGREDQERLARVFAGLSCPALLVIQRTDFILSLYREVGRERERRGEPFRLASYGKTYGYNVRGRNVRDATHLLVLNYVPPRRTRQGELPFSKR